MNFLTAILEQSVNTQNKGMRIVGSGEPIVIATPTKNKFVINAAAAIMMGIKDKDTVTISVNPTATDVNDMFAIHAIPSGKGCKLTSTADEDNNMANLSFNLANVWALVMKGVPGLVALSIETLERDGIVINDGKSANKKVFYELEALEGLFKLNEAGKLAPATEGEEDTFVVYALVKRSELPYTPKKGGKRPVKEGEIVDLGANENEAAIDNVNDDDFIDVE